jgi:hypothetical protein
LACEEEVTEGLLEKPALPAYLSVQRVIAWGIALFALAGVVRLFTLITFARGNPFAAALVWRTPDPTVLLLSSLLVVAAGALSVASDRASRLGVMLFMLHMLLAASTVVLIFRAIKILYLTGTITPQPF